MHVDIVCATPLEAVGLEAIVPSSFAPDAGDSARLIAELWAELMTCLGATPDSTDWDFVGITTPADDVVPPQRIRYVAGVTTKSAAPLPTGLTAYTIGGGDYAVIRYSGPQSEVDDFYREVYLSELDKRNLSTRSGEHLERLLGAQTGEHIELEAWVPVN